MNFYNFKPFGGHFKTVLIGAELTSCGEDLKHSFDSLSRFKIPSQFQRKDPTDWFHKKNNQRIEFTLANEIYQAKGYFFPQFLAVWKSVMTANHSQIFTCDQWSAKHLRAESVLVWFYRSAKDKLTQIKVCKKITLLSYLSYISSPEVLLSPHTFYITIEFPRKKALYDFWSKREVYLKAHCTQCNI